MDCKCSWVEAVLAVVIIWFAYMPTVSSRWIVIVAALLLLIHALVCKKCRVHEGQMMIERKSTKRKRR